MERDRVHFSLLHLSIYIINLDVNTVRDDGAEEVRVWLKTGSLFKFILQLLNNIF